MPISERAKQFMPFAALRGFGKVITEEEKVATEKPVLSEDETEKLNAVVSTLKKGDIVKLGYYDSGFIKEITGVFTGLDFNLRTITVIKTTVPFDDVLKVELVEKTEKPL